MPYGDPPNSLPTMSTSLVGSSMSNITITNTGSGYGTYLTPASATTLTTTTISGQPITFTSGDGYGRNDVVIRRNGREIAVATCIEAIQQHLCILVPDQRELDSNPALQLAYDHYLSVVRESVDPRIRAAYDSFQTLRNLTKE